MAIVLPDGILGSPGLGYVRQWLLTHTKILASIDLHLDAFQPFVSVQTSLLVLERKDPALVDLEQAAGRFNDYDVLWPSPTTSATTNAATAPSSATNTATRSSKNARRKPSRPSTASRPAPSTP